MFVHWGLYSLLCRDAWAMGDEDIPLTEYVELAKRFQPQPNAAREWAQAGANQRDEVHGDDRQAP